VGGLITGSSITVGNGSATVGNIINGAGNNIGNIGTSANLFNTVFANALSGPVSNVTIRAGSVDWIFDNLGDIRKSTANGVGNIGNSTNYFNTVFAKATSAQYADLAEVYTADAKYKPGTVVSIGGSAEITQCNHDHDPKVLGVISSRPAHVMNAGLESEHTAVVALTGRVPCMVKGPVRRGDMMVSAGRGRARSEAAPIMGSVIGKALEDFDGDLGMIEIIVGKI